jgi:hypothetical protein
VERLAVRGVRAARVRLDEEAGDGGGPHELAPHEIATFRLRA